MAIVECTTIDGLSRPCVCKNPSLPNDTGSGDGGINPLIEVQSVRPGGTEFGCLPHAPTTVRPRKMTVSYIGPRLPYLRMQGRWLDRAGFGIGTRVRVEVCEGRLIVEAIEVEQVEHLRCAEPNCPHDSSGERPGRCVNRARPFEPSDAGGGPSRPWYKVIGPAAAEALKEILPIARQRERLSMHALAARAEVSLRQIRALEEGGRLPSIPMLIVLAWALDLDPRDLFDQVLRRMNYPEGSRPVLANRAAPDIPRESTSVV